MYLALYRKYRPKTFEDVLSQPHITKTLKNEIQTGRTAHAYLFTGPRGTGKTTCSKILAQAVNCEHPVDGNPCLECETCRAIEQGATMDIVEIDAASNNGVDNIRDLRDEANYTPSKCRYRVYIIDETHMLSAGAFNALLKIMEEPPEHVKFILATTEAHKVPATILSRCQRFDFRRIRLEDIKARLLDIAAREHLSLEDGAAELIARLADGGMRDALSLLDHCAGFSDCITLESATQIIGLVDRDYLFRLTDCILAQDAAGAIREIDRLYSLSKDMQALLEELLRHFRNLMLLMTLRDADDMISALPDELVRLREYASSLYLPVVFFAMSELQSCIDKMGRNFDRRMTMELCMVRLCAPAAGTDPAALAERLSRLEQAVQALSAGDPSSARFALPAAPASVAAPASPAPTAAPTPAPTPSGDMPSEPPVAAPSAAGEILPLMEWAEILSDLMSTCLPLYGVLQDSRAFVGGGFLYIDSPSSLTGRMIKQEGNAARLLDIVAARTGQRYKIRVKSAPAAAEPETDRLSDLLSRARDNGIAGREE